MPTEISSNNKVNCANCVGACCRAGTNLELTINEASYFLKSGNRLKTWHPPVTKTEKVIIRQIVGTTVMNGMLCAIEKQMPVTLTAGHGFYQLIDDCVFLEKGEEGVRCGQYDNRPGICRDFVVGGMACLDVRGETFEKGRFGDWLPVELTGRPT